MERLGKYLNNIKEDRKFIVAIVFCTNIIDNLLISCIGKCTCKPISYFGWGKMIPKRLDL